MYHQWLLYPFTQLNFCIKKPSVHQYYSPIKILVSHGKSIQIYEIKMFFSLTPHGIYTIRDTKIYKKESKRKKKCNKGYVSKKWNERKKLRTKQNIYVKRKWRKQGNKREERETNLMFGRGVSSFVHHGCTLNLIKGDGDGMSEWKKDEVSELN